MVLSRSAGGVVFNRGRVLLVLQDSIIWSFPKGKVESGESDLEACRREIFEEAGLSNLIFLRELGSYQRQKIGLKGEDLKSVRKEIVLFLFRSRRSKLRFDGREITDAAWFDVGDVSKTLTHRADRAFFDGLVSKGFLKGLY